MKSGPRGTCSQAEHLAGVRRRQRPIAIGGKPLKVCTGVTFIYNQPPGSGHNMDRIGVGRG